MAQNCIKALLEIKRRYGSAIGSGGRTRKKVVGGRHRGAESAETSTPCFTWGPQPQWDCGGKSPVPR